MTKQPQDHVDHPLERLMFFSDAVFAIAITLLVIEIEVPHLKTGNPAESWRALSDLIFSFGAYILSFAVIGRFWMAHHAILGVMTHHSPRMMWPNMLMLMVVAFLPFATAYFAQNMQNPAPVQFYNIMLTLLAVASARVAWIATDPENVRRGFPAIERERMRGRAVGVVCATILTLIASFFVAGGLAQILLLSMPLMQKLSINWRLRRLEGVK